MERDVVTASGETPMGPVGPNMAELEQAFSEFLNDPAQVISSDAFLENFNMILICLYLSNLPCSFDKFQRLK